MAERDIETKKVETEQAKLFDLVGHEGWKIARRRIESKIMDLQNAFNIEDADPSKMLIDLNARKIASNLIFEWLRELEGDASQVQEMAPVKDKSYIFKKE